MKNELAVFNGAEGTLLGRVPDTKEEKVAMANAMSTTTGQFSDIINTEILLINYFVERKQITDDETGELRSVVRSVLIDSNGMSYNTLSSGIATSLKSIIAVFGPASAWEEPMRVKVKQVQSGKGRMYTLELI